MRAPIIVDTSVWVDFFKGEENEEVKTLTQYLENDEPIYLCPIIIQEVLQGIRNETHYRKTKEYLFAFNILNDDGIETALDAVNIYRSLRKKGVSIRKSNDCLIARYAYKYSLLILHRDRDFDLILKNYN